MDRRAWWQATVYRVAKSQTQLLKLEELLLLLHRPGKPRAAVKRVPYQTEKLEKLAEAIRREPGRGWDFALEAAKLNVSLRHFRTLFARVNRMTPGHFLLRERLDCAARELLAGQDAVKAIADRNGFADEFYFSRIFKKYYRLAPRHTHSHTRTHTGA